MTESSRAWPGVAERLGAQAESAGEPTRWFDELWSAGERDEIDVPWDRDQPMPGLVEAVTALGPGAGRHAVVVGAGLGADAEFLAGRGWRTTAFDVSPAAVRLVQARRPGSAVDYRVADLLDLPADLVGSADLVAEVFTLQAVSPSVRGAMTAGVRSLVAPGGTLVAVQMVRGERPADLGPPWLLDRAQMEALADGEVVLDTLEELDDGGRRLWLAVLHRSA